MLAINICRPLSESISIFITQLSFLENGKCNSHILAFNAVPEVFGMEIKNLYKRPLNVGKKRQINGFFPLGVGPG